MKHESEVDHDSVLGVCTRIHSRCRRAVVLGIYNDRGPPSQDHGRIAVFRGSCGGATASERDFKLQTSSKKNLPIRHLALRTHVEQMPNSVSYLPVPERFTASRGHARQRYARPLLPPPLPHPSCIRTDYDTERVWNPRKLRRAQVVWIASFPSRFSLLSLSDNDTNGAEVSFPPLGRTYLSAYGMLRYSL